MVGIIFWTTNGLVGVPELVPAETQAWLQQAASLFGNPLIDIVAIILVAAVILLVWNKRRDPQDTSHAVRESGGTITR